MLSLSQFRFSGNNILLNFIILNSERPSIIGFLDNLFKSEEIERKMCTKGDYFPLLL